MARCEMCGKRDRQTAHQCWDCGRPHWLDDCASAYFNDTLLWCWCGFSPQWQEMPHWHNVSVAERE